MAKQINYQKQIDLVDAKIQKCKEELESLELQKQELIELKTIQEENILIEYLRQNKLNALDIMSKISA